jgi:phosphoribosyl 1,2-cyclic phosphodiesterase
VETLRFASLGSGSRGNATVVQSGQSCLLIDCGFSLRETERRLARLGLQPTDLDAILVTHEHSDHSAGVERLSRRYSIPVHLTRGTFASGRLEQAHGPRFFCSEEAFSVGNLQVMPVAVPHDAREPCQFVIQSGPATLGVLTDLGMITPFVAGHYAGCDALLLECNHDSVMLRDGPYPPSLKHRVGGDWGHLNNVQAANFIADGLGERLRHLVVAHVSEKNNHRRCVEDALSGVGQATDQVVWAEQASGFDWLQL